MFPNPENKLDKIIEVDIFNSDVVREAVRELKKEVKPWIDIYGDQHDGYKVVPFSDGTYHCYYHPHHEFDILADTKIQTIYQYAIGTPTLGKGTVPSAYGVTFYRSWETPQIEDNDVVVIAGNSLDDQKYTAIFRGVKNAN